MKNFDVENVFKYHAPRPDQLPRYEAIRAKAREMAQLLEVSCPNSREKSTAFTQLQNAVMWANASIAINESGQGETAGQSAPTEQAVQQQPISIQPPIDPPTQPADIQDPADPPPASQPDPVVAAVEA